MSIACQRGNGLRQIERLRSTVRLAAGLTNSFDLDATARGRAYKCLERFAKRLKGIPAQRVRAVGTSTLRQLRDGDFISQAERRLGHEIEVISGHEEARLIYAAVARKLESASERRLVVDIGGGSTELIIGRGHLAQQIESVPMGCVAYTQRFFRKGRISRQSFAEARQAACWQLEYLRERYRRAGWDMAVGTSGTARGAWHVLQAAGWAGDNITHANLERLIERVVSIGSSARLKLDALREDRRPVFAGGLAVLAGVFDALGLDQLALSRQSLREGVAWDLSQRLRGHDVRERSVRAAARHFRVDRDTASRVQATAAALQQAATPWVVDTSDARAFLSWGARLHEVGRSISHAAYPQHGQYIVTHGELDGFSRRDRDILGALIGLHRGPIDAQALASVPRVWRDFSLRLVVLLRLAVLLSRCQADAAQPPLVLSPQGDQLGLGFDAAWLAVNPAAAHQVEQDVRAFNALGVKLNWIKAAPAGRDTTT